MFGFAFKRRWAPRKKANKHFRSVSFPALFKAPISKLFEIEEYCLMDPLAPSNAKGLGIFLFLGSAQ